MNAKINIIIDICRTTIPVIFIFIGMYFNLSGSVYVPLTLWTVFAFAWLVLANFIIDQSKYPRLAYIPTALDTVLITAISFCTGMVNSPLIAAYFVTTTVCSTNLKIRQGLFCTVCSIICYVGVSTLVFLGVLPYVNVFDSATRITLFNLVCASVLISMGIVCSHIMVRTIALEKEKERQAAIEATKAKSRFLANMSHEIRTPMNGVIAAADLALAEGLPPKVERYLNIIHASGHSLLGIINDILDFSKIEAGKLEIELTPFKVDELMDKVSNLFVNKTIEKDIELIVDIDPGTPMAVISDPLRLQQVITNLVGNALKFTDPGGVIAIGVSGTVLEAESRNPGDIGSAVLKFYTKDSGIGMKSEFLDRLFEPFSQEDASTTRKYGGTGLGLSISQKLVEMMGGRIWADSEPGKGTTFYFTIQSELQPGDHDNNLQLPAELRGKQVMIIDDCREALGIIAKTLTAFGLVTQTAAFGKDALDTIQKRQAAGTPFDLITLDWIMPELEGLEVARHIRNDLQLSTPIIMLTAFGKAPERQQAKDAGINAFLTKPASPAALFNAVLDAFGVRAKGVETTRPDMASELSRYKERLAGFRILLAEDNLTNQEIARAVLNKADLAVFVTGNGRQAVEKIYSTPFDLVLMDIQMPVMDGYEATRLIRKDPRFKDLPIIAMTAHAMKGDAEKCLAAGMNAHITKPIDQKVLFKTLWEYLKDREPPPKDAAPLPDDTLPSESDLTTTVDALSLPGIDIQGAMQALNLDWGTFKHILIGFHRHTRDVFKQIREDFKAGNQDGMRETAHSIKGSAANIGAWELEKAAAQLEAAIKENQPAEIVASRVEQLKPALTKVLTSLGTLAEKPAKPVDSQNTGPALPGDQLAALVADLAENLKAADPAGIRTAFESLRTQIDSPLLAPLSAHLDDYDYDQALAALSDLVERLELPRSCVITLR